MQVFKRAISKRYWVICYIISFLVITSVSLTSCTRSPPDRLDNICLIFKQYPDWYWAALDSKRRWGVSVPVQLAIIHQESHFNATARPPRKRILWIIPWRRPTSAYGYSQAVDHTWRLYQRQTGHSSASRNAFDDATDFVGWFGYRAHRKLGISRANAFRLYLAYHEGLGGYRRHTYRHKRWLIRVARKVQRIAWIYHAQLNRCRHRLKKESWWRRIF